MPITKIREGKYRWETEDFSGGYNLFKDPTKLNDNEFLQFENLISYKAGKFYNATKRNGIERYNTNTFGSAGHKLLSVSQFITTAQSTNINRIIVNTSDTKLKYCEGTGAPVEISTQEYNNKYRYETFKDTLYIINRAAGAASNFVYDGTNYLEMGCFPCPQTFSLSAVSLGNLNGNYTYLILYIYDENQESWFIPHTVNTNTDTQQPNGAVMGTTAFAALIQISTGGAKKVKITGIPTGNARVTARVIYRSKTVGTVLYYHSKINDNVTTEYIDNLPDENLVEEISIDYVYKPYTAKYAAVHNNRLILGNLKENQYSAPVSTGVTFGSESPTGNLTDPGARSSKYSYKFAHSYIIPTLTTMSGGGAFDAPHSGVLSVLSEIKSHELTAGNRSVLLSDIPNDTSWSGHTAIFRNTCQFVTNAVQPVAMGDVEITIVNSVADTIYKAGETVHISGMDACIPEGDYIIVSVDSSTQITISYDTAIGAYTASTGRVEGGTFYFLGITAINGTTFSDGIGGTSDTDMVLSSNSSFLNSGITISTGDKKFSSMVKASLQNKGDISPPEYEHNINQEDGDEITGVYSDEDSIFVLKDRNLYRLYTNSTDPADWIYRPVIQGTGHTHSVTDCKGFSTVKIDRGEYLFFMNNTVYHYRQGNAHHCSKKIQTYLDGLTFTNLDIAYNSFKDFAVITYSTSTIDGDILIYDLNSRDEEGNGTWYLWNYNTTANKKLQVRAPYILQNGTMIFGSEQPYLMKYNESVNQDNLWDGAAFSAIAIKPLIKLKTIDTGYISISRILLKLTASGTGAADGVKIDLVSDLASANYTAQLKALTNIEVSMNKQGRQISISVYNSENLNFSLFYIGFDFKPLHRTKGLIDT